MRKKITWLLITCLIMPTLLLSSCAPAPTSLPTTPATRTTPGPKLINYTVTKHTQEWKPDNNLSTDITISNTTTKKLLASNWTLTAIDQQGNAATGPGIFALLYFKDLFPGEEMTVHYDWQFGPQSQTITITLTYSEYSGNTLIGSGQAIYTISRPAP